MNGHGVNEWRNEQLSQTPSFFKWEENDKAVLLLRIIIEADKLLTQFLFYFFISISAVG